MLHLYVLSFCQKHKIRARKKNSFSTSAHGSGHKGTKSRPNLRTFHTIWGLSIRYTVGVLRLPYVYSLILFSNHCTCWEGALAFSPGRQCSHHWEMCNFHSAANSRSLGLFIMQKWCRGKDWSHTYHSYALSVAYFKVTEIKVLGILQNTFFWFSLLPFPVPLEPFLCMWQYWTRRNQPTTWGGGISIQNKLIQMFFLISPSSLLGSFQPPIPALIVFIPVFKKKIKWFLAKYTTQRHRRLLSLFPKAKTKAASFFGLMDPGFT